MTRREKLFREVKNLVLEFERHKVGEYDACSALIAVIMDLEDRHKRSKQRRESAAALRDFGITAKKSKSAVAGSGR